MIVDALISLVTGLIKLMLSPIPALPDVPAAILTATDWLLNLFASAVGFLQIVYSAPLLAAFAVMLVALLIFERLYWIAVFLFFRLILSKIR